MLLTLERSYLPHCTIGELHVPGGGTYYTIEPAWRQNQSYVSCIPEGIYDCQPHNGKKYKNVWVLADVPDRSFILFHAGVRVKHTKGCVLTGKALSEKTYTLVDSDQAIDELRQILPDRFQVRIVTKTVSYP
ncbi:DUF5675 family protein [Kistimonas asteriae]|uniref:DUF5675 family protein n=1 Tax=Kistimonas asteriae TaxID=517724 RepID=UPI001BAD80A8|nr:DUF5675 family protein [Kistimonas asteriae]